MSWFMAAVYDRFMRGVEAASGDAWRRELVGDRGGTVLEVGAGTGKNLEHYDWARIDRLILTEPAVHMRRKLEPRVRALPARVLAKIEIVGWDAASLDVPAATVDTVVATLVLCSVPSPARVLAEIERVLTPEGRLVFLEHVVSERPRRRNWQRRLEPAWRVVAGNCHLCRDTRAAIEAAGFEFDHIVRESARKSMPIVRETIRGVARKAAVV